MVKRASFRDYRTVKTLTVLLSNGSAAWYELRPDGVGFCRISVVYMPDCGDPVTLVNSFRVQDTGDAESFLRAVAFGDGQSSAENVYRAGHFVASLRLMK